MGRAFPPRPDCPDVPTSEAIDVTPFTFDTDLPPLITEFPIWDFPPPEPPSFDFGCYSPTITSAFSSTGTPKFVASIAFPKSAETGTCEPSFDFDVCIPCPDMEVTKQEIKTGIPELNIQFQKPGDPCTWEFEFDITVPPCATIEVGTVTIDEGPTPEITNVAFNKTSEEECTTEFDLEIKVPPCVTVGTTSAISAGPVPKINKFKATKSTPCNQDFELDLEVPPCVTNRIHSATIAVAATPSVSFTTTKGTGDCDWDFDLDIKVPPGVCVTLTPVATIEQVEGLEEPTIDFEAINTSPPDGCSWTLDLDIKIPAGGGGGGGAGSVCRARVATTEEIATYGSKTIDGVGLDEDDIVLVKDQNNKVENGTFKVKDGEWERTCSIGPGTMVSVREGAVNGQTEWMQMTGGEVIPGETELLFLKEKDCCCIAKAATVEAITLNGEQTVDHVDLVDGDICLVKDQAALTENGAYIVVDGDDWIRACPLEPGCQVSVNEGWTNGNSVWMLKASETPIVADETELSYKLMTTGILSARAATIKNEPTLNGEITVDDVPLFEGDICLVRVQDSLTANGPYLVKKDADWERIGPVFHNQMVNVREGKVHAGTSYQLIALLPDPVVVGTSVLFYQNVLHSVEAKAATVGLNLTSLSGLPTIDGVSLVEGDILLVKDQTNKAQNGPYVVNSTGSWKRIGATVSGQSVKVREGNRNGAMEFFLSESAPIIEDTTPLNYMSISPELGVHFAHHATFSPGFKPNVTLSGSQTIDGYTATPGSIVLVRDRAHGAGVNGLYLVKAGPWEKILPRAAPYVPRSFYLVFVAFGTAHFDSGFITFSNFETTRGLGAYYADMS